MYLCKRNACRRSVLCWLDIWKKLAALPAFCLDCNSCVPLEEIGKNTDSNVFGCHVVPLSESNFWNKHAYREGDEDLLFGESERRRKKISMMWAFCENDTWELIPTNLRVCWKKRCSSNVAPDTPHFPMSASLLNVPNPTRVLNSETVLALIEKRVPGEMCVSI